MNANGHQPAPEDEAGWDDALLEQWRDQAGRVGVLAIELFPGKPKIWLDLSGATELIVQGRITNALMREGVKLLRRVDQTWRATDSAEKDDDGLLPEATESDFWARHQELTEWQDHLIAAVWVGPPGWCKLADIPKGGRPRGMFCIHDIQPAARRRMLVDLIVAGAEGLATFREQSGVLAAASDGERLRPAAVELPDPDLPGAPAVLVRPGGVDAGDVGGAGAPAGEPEPGGPRAAGPDEHPAGAGDGRGAPA